MAYNPSMLTKTVVVTAAQLKNLNTTPIVIIPAVAGSFIDLRSVLLVYHHVTTPFNVTENDCLGLINGTLPNVFVDAFVDADGSGNVVGLLDQSVTSAAWGSVTMLGNPNINGSLPPADLVNQPVSLFQYDVTGTFPAGTNWSTGDGTVTVIVRYAVIEVAL